MAIALKFSKPESTVPWGFRLVGGVEFGQPIVVVKVNSDSIAESVGLEVGDIVARINDTPTAGLSHNDVHDLLLSAGLEFELGIRRGEITERIISDEDYDIEDSEVIKKAIEDEVLSEAINIINNMRNSIDNSREKVADIISENLTGQEEIVTTPTFQATTDVKKGRKWSTFLIKPDKPAPKPKKKAEEAPKGEPYRIVIKKQSRRPSQEKKVQFDQNVTELEVDFERGESQEPTPVEEKDLESIEIEDKVIESDEECIEEANNYEAGSKEEQEEDDSDRSNRDSLDMAHERLESFTSDNDTEIKPSLEEQLLAVQKQLQALSQLPSAIQVTLDAVSKQLASIVGARESEERNGNLAENTSSSKEEGEEPQTEEEFLEDTSVSEEAEAELLREDSDANSVIAEELEEDVERQEEVKDMDNTEEIEESEPNPYAGLTEEEKEALIRKEELEAKKAKTMEERTPKPIQRPIILPGGRKWSNPEDAIPSFRKPKMSDEKIIETIESNLETIIGKRKGESNCWRVPSRVLATKHINFLKYQPPPKNLDYLQRSEVYRLVHDMEPPVKGITSRAEIVPAVQDYYEATRGAP